MAGEFPLTPLVPYTLLLLLPPPEFEIGEREFGVVLEDELWFNRGGITPFVSAPSSSYKFSWFPFPSEILK